MIVSSRVLTNIGDKISNKIDDFSANIFYKSKKDNKKLVEECKEEVSKPDNSKFKNFGGELFYIKIEGNNFKVYNAKNEKILKGSRGVNSPTKVKDLINCDSYKIKNEKEIHFMARKSKFISTSYNTNCIDVDEFGEINLRSKNDTSKFRNGGLFIDIDYDHNSLTISKNKKVTAMAKIDKQYDDRLNIRISKEYKLDFMRILVIIIAMSVHNYRIPYF